MNENIKYDLFDDYTKEVTKKILSRKKTKEVRDELFSHLIEEYERFKGLGKSHTEAQEKTLDLMGDKQTVAEQFGKLYSISPSEYLGSAFTCLTFGMLFTSFQIDFFMGAREMVLFIGQALLLYALVNMRKADKMFDVAAKLCGGKYILTIVIQIIAMVLKDSRNYILYFTVMDFAFGIMMYGVIFLGIYNLFDKLENEVKKPNLILGYIFYFIYSASMILLFISDGEGSVIQLFIPPNFLGASIVQVMKCQLALCSKDNEIELSGTSTSREKAICWIVVIALAVIPVVSMIAISCSQPKTDVFEAVDTEESAEVIAQARENMLKLGFPNEYLADLPDSEVLRYKDAKHLEIMEPRNLDMKGIIEIGDFSFSSQFFTFYLSEGEMRVLIRLSLPDDSQIKLRNGLYLKCDDRVLPDNGKANFHLALSEYNTKTVLSENVSVYSQEGDFYNYYTAGFDFKFPNGSTNRRAYVAKNMMVTSPSLHSHYYVDATFIYEEFPVKTELQSIRSTALNYFDRGNSMVPIVGSFTGETVVRVQLGESIEYIPEWIGYEDNTEE